MARLDELPEALRRKIFRHLLTADQVRQPPNHFMIEHYNFEVSLMRVNRLIKADAEAILYGENKFVKLSWHFGQCHEAMDNHEVPFFRKKVENFNHHFAEITVTTNPGRVRTLGGSFTLNVSVLLLEDMPKLARAMRIIDLANFMCYNFKFSLSKPVPVPIGEQQALLLPFQQVRGTAILQNVAFTGPFDADITARVKEPMTQQVQWLRAVAWEIYDLALSFKRQGDLAFSLGKGDMTQAKYEDCDYFVEAALKQNSMTKDLDEEFDLAMLRFNAINKANLSLASLSPIMFTDTKQLRYRNVLKYIDEMGKYEESNKKMGEKNGTKVVPDEVFARFYFLLGIAHLCEDSPKPNKAGKAFAKSYGIISQGQGHVKEGYETAKNWSHLTLVQRALCITSILSRLPTRMLQAPAMKEYTTPTVEPEHWVMRQLGCKGPIPYEDKVKGCVRTLFTDKPHARHTGPSPVRSVLIGYVHPEVLREHVVRFRKTMRDFKNTSGTKAISWISLQTGQIGEKTILDDPAMAAALERVTTSTSAHPNSFPDGDPRNGLVSEFIMNEFQRMMTDGTLAEAAAAAAQDPK